MIFSGVLAATSSMFMPPAADATNAMCPVSRLSSRLRYSSRSIFDPDSTYTWWIGSPSAPVCLVVSRLPSMPAAAAATSSTVFASFTPPALPRPPACTCALTTQTLPPRASAAASTSPIVDAVLPGGKGIPNSAKSCLAWYSCRFIWENPWHLRSYCGGSFRFRQNGCCMHLRHLTSYTEIPAASWNALAGVEHPILQHEYLLALEASGSATAETGWQPL